MRIEDLNRLSEAPVIRGSLVYEEEIGADEQLQFLQEHLSPNLNPASGALHRFQIGSFALIIWNFSLLPLEMDRFHNLFVSSLYFRSCKPSDGENKRYMVLQLANDPTSPGPALECWIKRDHSENIEQALYKCTGIFWEKISLLWRLYLPER